MRAIFLVCVIIMRPNIKAYGGQEQYPVQDYNNVHLTEIQYLFLSGSLSWNSCVNIHSIHFYPWRWNPFYISSCLSLQSIIPPMFQFSN